MRKRKLMVLLAFILSVSLLFTACNKDSGENEDSQQTEETTTDETDSTADEEQETEDNETEDPVDDEVSMADWDGTWNNMGGYLDDAEVEPGFEELAEREGISVDEAKTAYKEKRHCEFDGLVVDGDHVQFLDGFKDDGGNVVDEADYKFVETFKVQHGNHELEWDVFEAEGDAKYPVLLMMPVHGEEMLTHFHMRYGDDAKDLLENEDYDGWYPTFVKPSSTYDQLNDEIAE
ncbi:MAG: ZinT/AdcA family metal-binding protein [Tissierellia bacterium]|nr:ZinT/AdcA family metal-binding protein [Tissierellia bacterium]